MGCNLSIKHTSSEWAFKEQLDNSEPDKTLIFVNAHYKQNEKAYRFQLNGLKRIVKLAIRIIWFKLHPVIIYGAIPEKEMLGSEEGRIFASNQSHKYFDITKINGTKLRSLIEEILPLPNEEMLREIIHRNCREELKIFIRNAEHTLSKTHKINNEEGRKELIGCMEHLQRVLYDDLIDGLKVSETVELLQNFKRSRSTRIEKNLKSIASNLNF